MQINKKSSEGKETSFVSTLMFKYLPYWPMFIILLLAGFWGAWLYLRYTTPMYEAYATILVKDEKKGVDESSVLEALNIPATKKIVENEIEVLRSRLLMNEVVKQLHLYAPVFEEGSTKATSAYTTSPVSIEAKNPEGLWKTDNIYFSFNGDKEIIINNKSYPLHQWVSTPYGELRFDSNVNRLKQASNPLFFRLYDPKDMASSLAGSLNVETAGKLSSVLKLRLKDEVPERGEDVLNRLISTYNQLSIDDKNKLTANTLAFIEKRLQVVEKELDSVEGRIQQYRSKKGVVNLSEQGKSFLQNVGDNDRRMTDLNMQLAVLDQVERYVVLKENKAGIVPSTLGVEDPVLSQLMQRLYQAELEYEKLRKTTAENNPMVVPIANEIEKIRPHILENIRNHRTNLLTSKNNLNVSGGIYNAMLQSIPQKERELAEISRQHTIKSNVYSFLLEKREQTAMAISSTVADSKVVDVAESSDDPVSPKPTFIYMVALVGAIGLGIGLISAKELLNKKILFRSEIESYTDVPVVAEISYTREKDSLSNSTSKISLAAEQFRQLRAAIGLCGNNNNNTKKKVLVTSSITGEGKSYICINLAISLALASKKVVLVDLDIRSPKTSSLLGVADKPGIAEFLEGTKNPDEIIWETGYSNLYTIGAGGDIDNARELILNGKLNELLSYLSTRFDYIIMDTSPVDPVTDAYVFSDYCDLTLFIVRHGYTPKTLVQLLDNNNKIKALKNPFIVFNDVRSRGLFVSTYGYGYGYGYQNIYRERSRKETLKLLEV